MKHHFVKTIITITQLAGGVEYTNCLSAEA